MPSQLRHITYTKPANAATSPIIHVSGLASSAAVKPQIAGSAPIKATASEPTAHTTFTNAATSGRERIAATTSIVLPKPPR